jgi:hypothetical protein
MGELLHEFMDSRGARLRVDRERGVIEGVKILGLESRNGRSYLPAALQTARVLYEGAKVNINHPKGPAPQPRDYQDRMGTIRRVEWRAGLGLFGDLVFNPKHALAEQLMWDAEHAPENVGLSHNVEARVARRGEQMVVEAITRVQSVDLVADPATTRGLFEATRSLPAWPSDWSELTWTDLERARPDLCSGHAATPANGAGLTEGATEWQSRAEQLQQQVDLLEKQQLARRLLVEARLPPPEANDAASRAMISATFWESLLAAADEASMRALIEERQRLVGAVQNWLLPVGREASPLAREAALVEHDALGALDARAFARAISGAA